MAKTKSQLRTENANNFPNNNSQFITPEKLRDFNNDIIDAVALEQNSELLGTGSFNNLSGSGFVSASTFIGDGSQLTGVSGQVPDGTVSGSSQIILQDTTGDLSGSRIDGSVDSSISSSLATRNVLTASFDSGSRDMTFVNGDNSQFTVNIPGGEVDTGSLIETASVINAEITFTKADGTTFPIVVDNVTSSLQTEDVFVNVKNVSGGIISGGLAVHAVGVTGENIDVELADSTNPNNMPAIGLMEETLSNNAVGRAIISGRLRNINTSALTAGASVYVNGSGTLTSNKPTGSDLIQNIGICGKVNATEGEIIVVGSGRSNDLPNITEGYIWVGNSGSVPQEFSTGSIAFTNRNNTFTGTQTFDNISVDGTGSFAYIESVTGSAKIIGDAFIILNNDLPTERYAGIVVQDTGSALTTASFQWDGNTNDWFLEYSDDGGATVEHGIALFGPEYATKGSPTYNTNNTIPKSDGGHHLNDSSITDNGSQVTINNPLDVQGNITTTGTVDGIDIQNLNGLVGTNSASIAENAASIAIIESQTGSYASLTNSNTFTNSSNIFSSSQFELAAGTSFKIGAAPQVGTFNLEKIVDYPVYSNLDGRGFSGDSAEFYLYGNNTAEQFAGAVGYKFLSSGSGLESTATFGPFGTDIQVADGYHNTSGILRLLHLNNNKVNVVIAGSEMSIGTTVPLEYFEMGNPNSTVPMYMQQQVVVANPGNGYSTPLTFNIDGSLTASADISSSGDLHGNEGIFGSTITASLQEGHVLVGDNNGRTVTAETASFGGGGGGPATVTNVSVVSNTASLDLSLGTKFYLDLPNGADTEITIANRVDGESFSLLVSQSSAGTGSVTFGDDSIKFAGGIPYQATNATQAEDVVSFEIFNKDGGYGKYVYCSSVKNLS